MDDVWILGVAHQELYVYHMRPRVLYPMPFSHRSLRRGADLTHIHSQALALRILSNAVPML